MKERLSLPVKGAHCRQNSFVIHDVGQFKLRQGKFAKWNAYQIEMPFVNITDYLFIYLFILLTNLNHFRRLKTSHKVIPIRLYYHLFRDLSAMIRANRECNETVYLLIFFFSFSFCSRHVSTCLVRTTASVFPLTKQTATFVPARKYSQENTAKTVMKRLKRPLGALAGTKLNNCYRSCAHGQGLFC